MQVIAIRRRTSPSGSEAVFSPGALVELPPRADVLVITLPPTGEAAGRIRGSELALLRPRPVVLNASRGLFVDHEARYLALRDGTVCAAAQNAWYRYPTDGQSRLNTPPAAYPFQELDNVVVSPHRAGGGGSEAVEKPRTAHPARVLNAAATGVETPDCAGIDAGY